MQYYQYISCGKILGYSNRLLTIEEVKGYTLPLYYVSGNFEFDEGVPFGQFKWVNNGSMQVLRNVVQGGAI